MPYNRRSVVQRAVRNRGKSLARHRKAPTRASLLINLTSRGTPLAPLRRSLSPRTLTPTSHFLIPNYMLPRPVKVRRVNSSKKPQWLRRVFSS